MMMTGTGKMGASGFSASELFEKALQSGDRRLPRGHASPLPTGGTEHAMFTRWLRADELSGNQWRHEGGVFLGRRNDKVLGWRDNRHLLTIASNRSGKGTGLIIPTLLTYEGSVVVIDVKGENARICAARRGAGPKSGAAGLGQDVFVLDPFKISGVPGSRFNPLSVLDITKPGVIDDAGIFASALVEVSERDPHWGESARAIIKGLILATLGDAKLEGRRDLVTVRRLLTGADPAIQAVLALQERGATAIHALQVLLKRQQGVHADYCRGIANRLVAAAKDSTEVASILSTAQTQTEWLEGDIAGVLQDTPQGSDSRQLKLGELKRSEKGVSIFLCLSAMNVVTHGRWLRVMIEAMFRVMEDDIAKPPKRPVLFVLDEFPILGHMESIEKAAGLMAGFGVKLWPIVQNVGQLEKHYKQAWQTFVANAGCITSFGVGDTRSQDVIVDLLGTTRISERLPSNAVGLEAHHSTSDRDDRQNQPLLGRHEFARCFIGGDEVPKHERRVLVIPQGSYPAVVQRVSYYDDPLFADEQGRNLFDPRE
ncbi:MAG: type IV secretory system conjugative DNA transfer family protein [Proteobacteria bacterium]|nr:type IV secretory system conjugative DNA transfer family protein [Pseudomonadota bacterium]